ncbi:MAG: hypothetical protein BGO37_00845 [Cellulomonas sp. 73-92]|nr:MAG: hypothetical protein BGO37_00845 [Cellulomonas sp. 73-92]
MASDGGGLGNWPEIERRARLIDQSITMQAALRDRDSRIATLLTSCVAIVSIVGIAFAFATNDDVVTIAGLDAQRATWLGWLAVVAGALSTIDLIIDRRGAARRRGEAVALLSALKAEYRAAAQGLGEPEAARLEGRYIDIVTRIPEIPERLFNRLKAKHLLKVEVSKELSAHPGISSLRARIRVALRATKG